MKDTKRGTQWCKFIALTVCAVYSNCHKCWVGPHVTIIPESLYDFDSNQVSQLRGNRMSLCREHLASYPSRVPSVSVAVIFLPPSIELIHCQSVSPSPCHLAAFVMSCEVLSDAPSISRKILVYLPVLHCSVYMRNHVMHCGFCGCPWFVGRLLQLQGT